MILNIFNLNILKNSFLVRITIILNMYAADLILFFWIPNSEKGREKKASELSPSNNCNIKMYKYA